YQAVRGMADPLLGIDLSAMLSGLEIRLAAELFEQLIGVLAFLVGFTWCAWVGRKLLGGPLAATWAKQDPSRLQRGRSAKLRQTMPRNCSIHWSEIRKRSQPAHRE